jgi:hypothetical protein
MRKFFSKDRIWCIVAAIFAVHMFNSPFVNAFELYDDGPWYGLDISWQVTLNYALKHHWMWGKDIIYTYGPLGFLSTRMGLGIDRLAFLAFDCFLVFNFFFIFCDFLKSAINKYFGLAIIIFITIIINTNYASDLSWILMIFSFYWMNKSYDKPSFFYFLLLSVIVTLAFYIKLNTGLIVFVLLFLHLINLAWARKISILKAGVIVLITVVLVIACGKLFHVDIAGYFRGALEIIKGYNDIMYLDETNDVVKIILYALLATSLFLFCKYGLRLIREKDYHRLFFVIISLGYLFLLRKQAFLRDEPQHLREFLSCAPLILIIGLFRHHQAEEEKLYLTIIFSITLISLLVFLDRKPSGLAFEDRYARQPDYISAFQNYNKETFLHQKDKRYIPERILNKIGNAPVDIFPWDSEYIIENKLNYKPRPIFQSFSAYTPFLQKANYDFYVKNAPEYLIYHYEAIDDRHPFNEETPVNFFIANNYTVADTFTSNHRWRIVLQKKPLSGALNIREIKKAEQNITDDIAVSGSDFIKIDIEYNLLGKLIAFFHKPPRVHIEYIINNDSAIIYKTSKELLQCGIMTAREINDTHDFVKYMQMRDSLPTINKIKLSVNTAYFADKIKLKYYNIH